MAYHRMKEFAFDWFDDMDVFVDVIGVHEGLELIGLKGHSDYADRFPNKFTRNATSLRLKACT